MTIQVNQFCKEIRLSSSAITHLEERRISRDTIEYFKLGFCPANSNYSFDLLNGRLIVPIYDVYGNHVAFSGRKIEHYSKDVKNFYQLRNGKLEGFQKFFKWKTSKWINSPYKKSDHLYNLNLAKRYIFDSGFCFIVEGYFDVMQLYQMGYKNVVALCGTSLTDRQCELLFRYCNKLVFMFDGDESGKIATKKSVIKARGMNLYSNIVDLPIGLDPDQLNVDQLEFIKNQVLENDEELYIKL
jgi:DNA primase